MKAFVVNKYSKTQNLKLSEIPVPEIKEHDVLVEVHAAGVNLLDVKIKTGEFKQILPDKTPFVLGHDVSGVVTKVGSGVSKFKVGDEVYARPADHRIGTFSEFIAINEKDLALKPKNLTMIEAASIPLVALTVWQALVEKANLKKGQKVFIQAGSGGVGTIAIQLAKYIGAKVATTASAPNFNMVKDLGADVIINYKTEDFESTLKDYDLVLNSQDTKTLEKSLNVVKPGANVISISGPPTPDFADEVKAPWFIKLVLTLLSSKIRKKARQLNVKYSFLFMRAEGNQLGQITQLIEVGAIKPVIDKVFPFEQTNEALAYVEKGRTKGKVVIRMK